MLQSKAMLDYRSLVVMGPFKIVASYLSNTRETEKTGMGGVMYYREFPGEVAVVACRVVKDVDEPPQDMPQCSVSRQRTEGPEDDMMRS
ncbi:hypothetical protein CHU98_g1506 [Xylaria longipes]|nr:hypothetical protein CHU98_g1506 [Xylaria longipes]